MSDAVKNAFAGRRIRVRYADKIETLAGEVVLKDGDGDYKVIWDHDKTRTPRWLYTQNVTDDGGTVVLE